MAQFKVTEELNRLDKIVLNHYGDLSMFNEVVNVNPHITSIMLAVDSDVYLPAATTSKVEETLW